MRIILSGKSTERKQGSLVKWQSYVITRNNFKKYFRSINYLEVLEHCTNNNIYIYNSN